MVVMAMALLAVMVMLAGRPNGRLLLGQLAIQVESKYMETQRVAPIHSEIAIVNCATKYITMIVQVIQILSPKSKCPRSVATKLATIRSLAVHLVVVFVVVEGGLEAKIASVAEEFASATIENLHDLINRRLSEPILLELQVNGLVLHQPVPIVERRATIVAGKIDPKRTQARAESRRCAGL